METKPAELPHSREAGGFGPWSASISPDERKARWRSMAALAMIYAGGRHPLLRTCLAAERNDAAAAMAWLALESLPALTRRRLLCAYAALDALAARSATLPVAIAAETEA